MINETEIDSKTIFPCSHLLFNDDREDDEGGVDYLDLLIVSFLRVRNHTSNQSDLQYTYCSTSLYVLKNQLMKDNDKNTHATAYYKKIIKSLNFLRGIGVIELLDGNYNSCDISLVSKNDMFYVVFVNNWDNGYIYINRKEYAKVLDYALNRLQMKNNMALVIHYLHVLRVTNNKGKQGSIFFGVTKKYAYHNYFVDETLNKALDDLGLFKCSMNPSKKRFEFSRMENDN